MRIFITAMAAALALAAAAQAQDAPSHAQRVSAAIDPVADDHIAGASVKAVPFAEWETNGGNAVQIVWGDDVAKAPANAARYEEKKFVFSTGVIRVLTFHKNTGGMFHQISTETNLFMLNGTGSVGVGGKTEALQSGDAVNYPSGVLRGTEDATVIVWTVTGTKTNEASKAQLIHATDAKTRESADWGPMKKRMHATTPEELAKAPKNAVRLGVVMYQFDGNSIRVAKNYKGGPTTPGTAALDALLYITSGKMEFYQGDNKKPFVTVAGDAIREIAGVNNYWVRLEDSSFIAISSVPLEGEKKSAPLVH